MAAALATSASMSRPAVERIWIVTSRATVGLPLAAAARTSMTAPVVSEAQEGHDRDDRHQGRRPEIVACGTIGVSKRGSGSGRSGAGPLGCSRGCGVHRRSVVDMQAALVQHEAARVELIHQRDVVGGDHHRRARTC